MADKKRTSDTKIELSSRAVALAILILLVAAALLLFKCCSDVPAESAQGLLYDDRAVSGGWNETDTKAVVDSLNQQVEEGMINLSMNTSPTFRTGTAAGDLMIVNERINRYPQVVEITRNDTGALIYTSGGIPVGSKVETAALNVPLSAGTYECTAMFYNVDPDTGERLGCAGAVITITVQK